ncbi:hypothetical protein ONZ45_g13699 [Pleurotus djamor]|nr:hypothetical protein ONZ45_g13699 [Pleurotus djamor]
MTTPPVSSIGSAPPAPDETEPPSNASVVPDVPTDMLTAPPQLKRGWAKGSRLDFLAPYVPRYFSALQEKRSKAIELADEVTNDYFKQFYWRLRPDAEPNATTPQPTAPETLSAAEKELKGQIISKMRQSIYNWLDYRAHKTKGVTRLKNSIPNSGASPSDDPYAVLLAQISGIALKPKKLLAPWQQYMKTESVWKSLKPTFDAEFKASGHPEGFRASERNAFMIKRYNALDDDQKAHYSAAASDDHDKSKQEVRERLNQELHFTPEERQALIDRLPEFLDPLFSALHDMLGMHVSILIGGPEPKKGGKLNVISIHYGADKSAIPKNWAKSNKTSYKNVTDSFLLFLESAYTEEECAAAALPVDPLLEDLADEDDADDNDDDEDEDDDQRHRDRHASKRHRHSSGHRSHHPSPGRSKNIVAEIFRRAGIDIAENLLRAESIATEEGMVIPRERMVIPRVLVPTTPISNADVLLDATTQLTSHENAHTDSLVQRTMATTSQTLTGNHKRRIALLTGLLVHDPSVPAGNPNGRTFSATTAYPPKIGPPRGVPREVPIKIGPPRGAPREAEPPVPPPSDDATSPDVSSPPSPSTTGHRPRHLKTTPPDEGSSLPPLPSDAPSWLQPEYARLARHQHGPEWTLLVSHLVELETLNRGIKPRGPLKAKDRPLEVEWWVARGRRTQPDIEADSLEVYASQWWTWWATLQPEWRGSPSPLVAANPTPPNADWDTLDRPGINGFLSVVFSLGWWAECLARDEAKDVTPTDRESWGAAVEDVTVVLQGLCESKRSRNAYPAITPPMGRPRLYHTAAEQREAKLARKRRYYDRNQETITEKARQRYRQRNPPKPKETTLKNMIRGAEQSELSSLIDHYLEICVKCDDMFRPNEAAFARTLCDLVLVTDDFSACARAIESVDLLYTELVATMDKILQVDGIGNLWRQCDDTLQQLRRADCFVTEIECYASDMGGLKAALERASIATPLEKIHPHSPLLEAFFHLTQSQMARTRSANKPPKKYVPPLFRVRKSRFYDRWYPTLDREMRTYLRENAGFFRKAQNVSQDASWFRRFWYCFFDRFPIAIHVEDLDERDFFRRPWKIAVKRYLKWLVWNFKQGDGETM